MGSSLIVQSPPRTPGNAPVDGADLVDLPGDKRVSFSGWLDELVFANPYRSVCLRSAAEEKVGANRRARRGDAHPGGLVEWP